MTAIYDGTINVGDEFEWAPPGHGHWPGAYCKIRVTKIIGDDSEDREDVIVSERIDGPIGCHGPAWNEESHFREMVRAIDECQLQGGFEMTSNQIIPSEPIIERGAFVYLKQFGDGRGLIYSSETTTRPVVCVEVKDIRRNAETGLLEFTVSDTPMSCDDEGPEKT